MVQERVVLAHQYFKPLFEQLSKKVLDHMKAIASKAGTKAYITELKEVEALFFRQLHQIHKTELLISATLDNKEVDKKDLVKNKTANDRAVLTHQNTKTEKATKEKKPKEDTKKVSFDLFKQGKSIEEIAKQRAFVTSTIENHLTHYISEGELDVLELLDESRYKKITLAAQQLSSTSLSTLKEYLGKDFSFTDIRMALAAIRRGTN